MGLEHAYAPMSSPRTYCLRVLQGFRWPVHGQHACSFLGVQSSPCVVPQIVPL